MQLHHWTKGWQGNYCPSDQEAPRLAARSGAHSPTPGKTTAMYSATTRNIQVTVQPTYLVEQSAPAENHYVWAYHIRIDNAGRAPVQLLSRFWQITDALGRVLEVRGPGVVGEQPMIPPGGSYEYTSGTPLKTPSGIMVGTYQMETKDGERFEVAVPAFSLDSPHQPIRLH